MIFGNVLRGKFGRDLVGEWRPPARYVAAAGGGCSVRAVPVLAVPVLACNAGGDREVAKVPEQPYWTVHSLPRILSVLRSKPTCRWLHIGHEPKNFQL